MNSRFAFSLAARITFNNESLPRPRARVSTAPYTNESIPDARVVSLLFAPRARIAAVPRVPIASSDRARARRSRASLSRVALDAVARSEKHRTDAPRAPTSPSSRARRPSSRRSTRASVGSFARRAAPRRRVVDRVVVVARRRLRSVPGTRRCAIAASVFRAFMEFWNLSFRRRGTSRRDGDGDGDGGRRDELSSNAEPVRGARGGARGGAGTGGRGVARVRGGRNQSVLRERWARRAGGGAGEAMRTSGRWARGERWASERAGGREGAGDAE